MRHETSNVKREYTHQELNQEVTAIGGHYVLVKKVRLLIDPFGRGKLGWGISI